MRWCSIKPTTYKKRLKQLNPSDRETGYRGITLINPNVVYSTFCPNTPPLNELNSIRSYSNIVEWDFFGNIVPVSSKSEDLKNKWKYLIDIWSLNDSCVELVYSIEPNPRDYHFHSHFLLKTSLSKDSILKGLILVCDQNNKRESRIHLSDFNINKGSGIDYTLKNPIGGFDYLTGKVK